ncbi:MAG: hypothetical protein R3E39_31750 [Anaerolineae bacterium]
MKQRRIVLVLSLVMVLALFAVSVKAQDMPSPQVNVGDQLVLGGFVTIDSIYSEGPGYVVIHRASDGAQVGVSQPLNAGWTNNLRITLDTSLAEAQMSAMLHVDDNAIGTYEFGTVEGADGPVKVGDAIVNTLFNAQVLDAGDQKVVDNSITIKSVAVPVDSWVVVHSGDAAKFGGVLGQTLVKAGTAADVKVALSGDLTSVLWPMLHVDDGVAGTYEFAGGEIDAPVVLNGAVATFPIWTVNHLRVNDQAVVHGDNMTQMEGMEMAGPSIRIKSVLSEGPGIVVIHANDNGNAGAILGAAFVEDGVTNNVDVQLDTSGGLTPIVWPMLHIDAGTVGVYDGLDVDGVASADGQPVTFTTNAAPALVMADQAIGADGTITIKNAIMDAPGWIAIHSDNNGAPGPVIATALLHTGANWNVKIAVDAAAAGAKVFPMLHYDTNTPGTYEFGSVDGADAPVFVQGNVVVGPLSITQ